MKTIHDDNIGHRWARPMEPAPHLRRTTAVERRAVYRLLRLAMAEPVDELGSVNLWGPVLDAAEQATWPIGAFRAIDIAMQARIVESFTMTQEMERREFAFLEPRQPVVVAGPWHCAITVAAIFRRRTPRQRFRMARRLLSHTLVPRRRG